jgi:hypothetical protein
MTYNQCGVDISLFMSGFIPVTLIDFYENKTIHYVYRLWIILYMGKGNVFFATLSRGRGKVNEKHLLY